MTSKGRGGARVPDGVPRPSALPFGQGSQRTDLEALPGTPGTELPAGIDPTVGANTGQTRRALADIPLQQFATDAGGIGGPSQRPGEPIQTGIPQGPGGGPESLIPQPDELSDRFAAREMASMYPLMMRLATMPHATQQTKILAQKLRANLPVAPEQVGRQQAGFPEPPAPPQAPVEPGAEEVPGGTPG